MGIWSRVLCILCLWFVGWGYEVVYPVQLYYDLKLGIVHFVIWFVRWASNWISKQKNHITQLWPTFLPLQLCVFWENSIRQNHSSWEWRKILPRNLRSVEFCVEFGADLRSLQFCVEFLFFWEDLRKWVVVKKRREEGRNLEFGFRRRRRRSKHEWRAAADHEQKLVSTNTPTSTWGGGSCSQRTTSSANKDSIGVMTMTFQFVCS